MVEVDEELLPLWADAVAREAVLSAVCLQGCVPVLLQGHGHEAVGMIGGQLLFWEVDIASVTGELALVHGLSCDKTVRLIIHIEREAADMILEHVCPLNIIVVDKVDIQSCRTVAQVFCHHVATTQCQCGHHGHKALLYDESNVHCRLKLNKLFVFSTITTLHFGCGVPKAQCGHELRCSTLPQSHHRECYHFSLKEVLQNPTSLYRW